ncbi:hypothetical protein N2152v2_004701 [Parachlorella kessleri]
MQQQAGAALSLATSVGAKEFIPTAPPGLSSSSPLSKGLGKSSSTPSLPKAGSNSSLSSAALNAPVFVPGASPLKPTVRSLGGKQQAAAVAGPLAGSSPQLAQQSGAQPSGRVPTPDLGLPEGDDLLGMTAVTPGDGKDVAAQAADMFRSLSPFPPPGGGRGRGGPPQQQTAQRAGGRPGSGRGGGAPPPPYASPGPPGPAGAGAGAGIGGRGQQGGSRAPRGRGRRAGPAQGRPSAAYVTAPGRMLKAGFFAADSVRQELQQRSYLIQAQPNPETEGDYGLPEVIQQYATLYPLEDLTAAAERMSSALGVRTQVVKAISRVDGQAYSLRRLDPRQVIPTAELLAAAEESVERWGPVANHPNLVGLREAFISNELDATPALFFSHDYHPGSLPLEQAHIQPTHTPQGLVRSPASEEQLWSYLVQLTAALRAVHSAGLALRPAALAPSKVLLTTSGRVRVGSLGVQEVLASEGGALAPGPEALAALQRQDLCGLGNLLLVLACAGRGAAPSLEFLTAHFSRDFCHVVAGLLAAGDGTGFGSWRALAAALGDRVFDELDAASLYGEALLGELGKECENGRLLRLLAKLSMVTERPELGGDTQWAETGDRYIAKLFRDFVFHQVDEEGAPLLDYGLVAEALNKADAGVPEKASTHAANLRRTDPWAGLQILLLSRDEVSLLVVSYADIKRCIQSSYAELRARAASSGGGAGAVHRSRSKAELGSRDGEKRSGSAASYY